MTVENLKGNTDLSIKSGSLKQFSPIASATTLLNEAVYYIDASSPTNWGSLGYVRLNGVSGNYLTVPDATNLDITGDIDIRARVSLDDWTPSAVNCIIAKEQTTTTRSYRLQVNTDGTLSLLWTTDGTTLLTASSTVATGVADGAVKWIRATLDVDNGASGRDAKFYTSDNGTTWTQLGTTVTQAGTTSIYSSTSQIGIGSRLAGTTELMTGNFYRAQILNGIDGTTVLDVNIATDFLASNEDSFTATSGQTVTVNGVDTIANKGTAGSLLPTTLGSSTAADSNDPKFLDHTGTNYVYLPGSTNDRLSIPDAANLDVTDLDVKVRIAFDNGDAASGIASRTGADPNRAWLFTAVVGATGLGNRLQLTWYPTGSQASAITAGGTATQATGFISGQTYWVRATLDVDNGAGGYEVKFYKANDSITVPTSWTQIGTTITGATTTNLPNVTQTFDISNGNGVVGKVFRAQLMDGIDGTAIADIDTSVITAGSATSFTAVTGQTVTINRSTSGRKTVAVTQPTWLFGTDDYMEVNNRYMSSGTYLYLPGVASNNCTTPDAAALDITGDIDIRVKVAMDDWTPSATQYFVAKLQTQRSYGLQLNTDGRLVFVRSTDGSATTSVFSGVTAVPFADGATGWVRVTFDVDNGAGGNDTIFYTSTDGTNWTQLGTTQTNAGTTATFNSNAPLEIGTGFAGVSGASRGKFFRAQVLNGINGTVAFDANFETSITSLLQTSFTESSANAATVTINRSGSAFRSAGIIGTAGYLYPGATNTFTASAINYLDFGASDSFTIFLALRLWDTISSAQVLILKGERTSAATLTAGKRWLFRTVTSNQGYIILNDGTNLDAGESGVIFTSGQLGALTTAVAPTVLQSTLSSDVRTLSTRNAGNLEDPTNSMFIGGAGAVGNTNMELYAAAVWRRRLLAPEIGAIYDYFKARD